MNIGSDCPTLILLLREPRPVALDELRSVVSLELGSAAAATVQWVGENAAGGAYMQWRNGATPHHLGRFSQPYISLTGKCEVGRPIRWKMREEVAPEDPALCEAWMAHNASLYVDALNIGRTRDDRDHRAVVLRIASRFVDDRCVLLWLAAIGDHKRVLLPSPTSLAAIQKGLWPGG
ncbi:MAG: hypothetical protein ACKVS9_00185 [Phycisphaerae bacterium]